MNAFDKFNVLQDRHDAMQPPDYREPEPEWLEARAKAAISYWTRNDSEHYSLFFDALKEVVSTDANVDPLFTLFLAKDTAQLGHELARRIEQAIQEKAAQYAEDEFFDVVGPFDRVPRDWT